MKQKLIETYLDWWNGYLTVDKWAEHNGIEEHDAKLLIQMGAKYHNENAERLKAIKERLKAIKAAGKSPDMRVIIEDFDNGIRTEYGLYDESGGKVAWGFKTYREAFQYAKDNGYTVVTAFNLKGGSK